MSSNPDKTAPVTANAEIRRRRRELARVLEADARSQGEEVDDESEKRRRPERRPVEAGEEAASGNVIVARAHSRGIVSNRLDGLSPRLISGLRLQG